MTIEQWLTEQEALARRLLAACVRCAREAGERAEKYLAEGDEECAAESLRELAHNARLAERAHERMRTMRGVASLARKFGAAEAARRDPGMALAEDAARTVREIVENKRRLLDGDQPEGVK